MEYQVWECKIVVPINAKLPKEFDFPPRIAAIRAVEDAGINVISCFSGWAGTLSQIEKGVVKDR